ncbi:hypothetical protein [Kitasatospora sp. HPMI-4]|uniref:hypothetical protein n=1 Tax=Kitasatospora sp. HPMI-4 TaxID=3448443 RepID=UPI003F1DE2E3
MGFRRLLAGRSARLVTALATSATLMIAASGTASAVNTAGSSSLPADSQPAAVLHPGAPQLNDTGAIRNLNTGRCIDDSFAYGLRAFGCNGLNYQQFTGQ